MGKKPVLGLAGLVLASLALSGCQDCKLCGSCKDKSYNTPSMLGKNNSSANSGVQQAGAFRTQPAGSVPVGPPGSNFASPGRTGATGQPDLTSGASNRSYNSSPTGTGSFNNSPTGTGSFGVNDPNCANGNCLHSTTVTTGTGGMRPAVDPSLRTTSMTGPGSISGTGPGSTALPGSPPGPMPQMGPGNGPIDLGPPPIPVHGPNPNLSAPPPDWGMRPSPGAPVVAPNPATQSRYSPSMPPLPNNVPPMPPVLPPLGAGRGDL